MIGFYSPGWQPLLEKNNWLQIINLKRQRMRRCGELRGSCDICSTWVIHFISICSSIPVVLSIACLLIQAKRDKKLLYLPRYDPRVGKDIFLVTSLLLLTCRKNIDDKTVLSNNVMDECFVCGAKGRICGFSSEYFLSDKIASTTSIPSLLPWHGIPVSVRIIF